MKAKSNENVRITFSIAGRFVGLAGGPHGYIGTFDASSNAESACFRKCEPAWSSAQALIAPFEVARVSDRDYSESVLVSSTSLTYIVILYTKC